MYTAAYIYINEKVGGKKCGLKIAIRSDRAVAITYTKHTPIISLRDIGLEGEDNWCLAVCAFPLQVTVTFPETRGWKPPNSVFILQIRHTAYVIKDGADLFVADQVGIVRAARASGVISLDK